MSFPPSAVAGTEPHPAIETQQIRSGNTGVAWVLAALVGAAYISLAHDIESPLVRNLPPCVVMLLYCLFGWSQGAKNTEKLADSLYFLGFIWTLVALIDALMRSGASGMTGDRLFVTFGYALVTTGLGMFLRMVLIQLDYTIPDQMQDSRNALAEGIQTFRDELAVVLDALRDSRDAFGAAGASWIEASGQMSADMVDAASRAAESAEVAIARLTGAVDDIRTVVVGTGTSTNEVSKAVSQLGKQVISSSDSLVQTLTSTTKATSDEFGRVAVSLSRVQVPENLVAHELARLVEQLSEPSRALLETVGRIVSSADAAQHATSDGARRVVDALEKLRAPAEATAASLGSVGAASGDASAGLRQIPNAADASAKSMRDLAEQQAALGRSLASLSAQVERVLSDVDRTKGTSWFPWNRRG